MYRTVALFALGLLPVGSSYAQDSRVLESGAQIRFTLLADDLAEQANRSVFEVREQLGDEAFTAAWEEGRAMSLEQASADAFE